MTDYCPKILFYTKITRVPRDLADPLLGAEKYPKHLVKSDSKKLSKTITMVTLEGITSQPEESPAGQTWRFSKSINKIIVIGVKPTIYVQCK